MKIHCIICTRDRNLNIVTQGLVKTLISYGVNVKLNAGATSIFEAYTTTVNGMNLDPDDIVILCHDDLKIFNDQASFLAALSQCLEPKTGIIGPAGTTSLGENAVWWDQERWAKGLHSGVVWHPGSQSLEQIMRTEYGPHREVVVLDGLFLAAQKKVWDHVGLEKPEYFEGEWDFYDIHYTSKAHLLGYENYTVPISILHYSKGELAGRDSWHKNRTAFVENTKLPLELL